MTSPASRGSDVVAAGPGLLEADPMVFHVSPRVYRMLIRAAAESGAEQELEGADIDWRRRKRLIRQAGDAAVRLIPESRT